MPALFEEEALKAQAIASRSYALSKEVDSNIKISSTINDQIYLTQEEMQKKWGTEYSKYYEKIKKIVISTENKVMKKNNKILKSYYFAMSNGYTENSVSAFSSGDLISVESKWETDKLRNFLVTTKYTKEEILNALNINSTNLYFSEININKTNRVENLKVNDIIFKGIEFRKLLNLRSTDFTIEETLEGYIITTKGYGHGVGMSQYGANEMAKSGYSYEEILKHYYKDIIIENI